MKPVLFLALVFCSLSFSPKNPQEQKGYVLEHEKDVAAEQPGPHDGGGKTTAHNFFAKAEGYKQAFRKRVLHQGSSIGYHLQQEDEVYYIVSGQGVMKMNGETLYVKEGDAILTRTGSSHSIKPAGKEDLTIIITYEK